MPHRPEAPCNPASDVRGQEFWRLELAFKFMDSIYTRSIT